jgi:hypothetical protein
MAILSRKITTYTQNIKDLADTPALTATQLKAFFDGRGDNELKDSINGIVDDLSATTDGASGADQIGATPVKDGGAETVQGILEELKDVDNHINGSVNKVFTATEKSKLAGIAENANAYVHPNHSGDVTSVSDGATTIAAKAVTLAKMADMATASLLGRKTADTGVPEVLSKSDAQTLLNVEDGANNYVHPSDDGNLHVPATSTTNNGKVLKAGATAGSIAWADDTDTITTINGKTGAIAKEDVVALGIPAQDTVYEHPATHSADIITDGTTNKTFTAILKSAYDGLVTLFSGISSVVTTLGADNTSIPTSKAVADAISGAGGGDMLKSTYDPSNIGANVYNADNHIDGTTNKVFTATEQTKLGTIAENANNYSHPTGDGNLHVPANSTTNEGKVLTAGASAGTYTWETPTYGVGEDDRYVLVRNGRWI